jgi:hypothetical protein
MGRPCNPIDDVFLFGFASLFGVEVLLFSCDGTARRIPVPDSTVVDTPIVRLARTPHLQSVVRLPAAVGVPAMALTADDEDNLGDSSAAYPMRTAPVGGLVDASFTSMPEQSFDATVKFLLSWCSIRNDPPIGKHQEVLKELRKSSATRCLALRRAVDGLGEERRLEDVDTKWVWNAKGGYYAKYAGTVEVLLHGERANRVKKKRAKFLAQCDPAAVSAAIEKFTAPCCAAAAAAAVTYGSPANAMAAVTEVGKEKARLTKAAISSATSKTGTAAAAAAAFCELATFNAAAKTVNCVGAWAYKGHADPVAVWRKGRLTQPKHVRMAKLVAWIKDRFIVDQVRCLTANRGA